MKNGGKWQPSEKRLFMWTVLLPFSLVVTGYLVKSPILKLQLVAFRTNASDQLVVFPTP